MATGRQYVTVNGTTYNLAGMSPSAIQRLYTGNGDLGSNTDLATYNPNNPSDDQGGNTAENSVVSDSDKAYSDRQNGRSVGFDDYRIKQGQAYADSQNNTNTSNNTVVAADKPVNPFADQSYQDSLKRYYDQIKTEYRRGADKQIQRTNELVGANVGARGVTDSGINTALQRRALSDSYSQLGAQLAGVAANQAQGVESRANIQANSEAKYLLDQAKTDSLNSDSLYRYMGANESLDETGLADLKANNPQAYTAYMAGREEKKAKDINLNQTFAVEAVKALIANSGDLTGDQFANRLNTIYKQSGLSTDVFGNIVDRNGPDGFVETNADLNPEGASFYANNPVAGGAGTSENPYSLDFVNLTTRPTAPEGFGKAGVGFFDYAVPPGYNVTWNSLKSETPYLTMNSEDKSFWDSQVGKYIKIGDEYFQVAESPIVKKQIAWEGVNEGKGYQLYNDVITVTKNGERYYVIPPQKFNGYDRHSKADEGETELLSWTAIPEGQRLDTM